jgi:hypothetical protein
VLTLALVVAFLATPAGALAQSAGDEQYADPFGSQPPGEKQNQQSSPPATSSPASPAPAAGGDGTASAAPTAQPAQADPALPRTGGFPAPLLGAIGYALLVAGAAFRRQLR